MNSFDDSIASMSQDFDFQMSNPPVTPTRGRAVTLATMRGVINLFNHYFRQLDEYGNRKKMTRVEKHRRWISYKQKIWDEYGRRITGTYTSENALIRRYSDPLTFLKYRLKRSRNLKVSDLSETDQAYYREIGGTDDVNDLINRFTHNIDSIKSFSQPPAKRPRLERPNISTVSHQTLTTNSNQTTNVQGIQNVNHNHNQNYNRHQFRVSSHPRLQTNVIPVNANDANSNVSSPSNSSKRKPDKPELDQAIDQVAGEMDIFEQEQLLKKKIEAFEMTQEKVRALVNSIKSLLGNEPQMIGAIPGIGTLDDQLRIFFDYWMDQNKAIILSDVETAELFFDQMMILKSDAMEYQMFLQKWKFMRMLKNDEFFSVWKWMVTELNLSVKSQKQELDDEEKKNDDDFNLV